MMWEMGKYAAKGGLATIANVALMTILVEFANLSPEIAAPISTLALIPTLGYPLTHRYVFKADHGGHTRRLPAYASTIITGKAANYLIFLGLLTVGVWYPLAWVIGSGLVFLGTFTVNRWLWNKNLTPT